MRLLFAIVLLTIYSCSNRQNIKNTKLDLSGKHLKSVPDSVFEKLDITALDLGSSEVTFYPPLSVMTDSNANEISDLPNKIGRLTNLRVLKLNSNKLTSLPDSIIKLGNLESLDLSINKGLSPINELDKLKNLQKLKVLKIVDVKINKSDLKILRKSLRPDIKIAVAISEYSDDLE